MKSMLFILISAVAIVSIITGLMLMSVPDGSLLHLTLDQLKGTPFKDFRVPGLIMFVSVGLTNLVAVFLNMTRHLQQYQWSLWGGIMLIAWTVAQDILTTGYYVVNIFFIVIGIMIVLMSVKLKGKTLV